MQRHRGNRGIGQVNGGSITLGSGRAEAGAEDGRRDMQARLVDTCGSGYRVCSLQKPCGRSRHPRNPTYSAPLDVLVEDL